MPHLALLLIRGSGRLNFEIRNASAAIKQSTEYLDIVVLSNTDVKEYSLRKPGRRFRRVASIGVLKARPKVLVAAHKWTVRRKGVVTEEPTAKGAESTVIYLHAY